MYIYMYIYIYICIHEYIATPISASIAASKTQLSCMTARHCEAWVFLYSYKYVCMNI